MKIKINRLLWAPLTPFSSVLLEKLIVPQIVNKLPAVYGTPKSITVFTEAHDWTMSSARWLQHILFNIILEYKCSSPGYVYNFTEYCTHTWPPHACYNIDLSHSRWIDHHHILWREFHILRNCFPPLLRLFLILMFSSTFSEIYSENKRQCPSGLTVPVR